MKVDLTFLLSLFSLISGVIWLVDARRFAPARALRAAAGETVSVPVLVEYSRSLFPAVFVLLILRAFVAEPFRIPSESMEPNLFAGDFILVSKYSYGLRLPVTDTLALTTGKPQRGDVVVFRYPARIEKDPMRGESLIKRIVGLPGDRVQVVNDRVTINGQPVAYEAKRVVFRTNEPPPQSHGPEAIEHLPGRDHAILDGPGTVFEPLDVVVGPGQYFVLGDNRDHSDDSRGWGFLPEANLVGKASYIWLHCRGLLCGDSFQAARIGQQIH